MQRWGGGPRGASRPDLLARRAPEVADALELTRALVLVNAECHTAWNVRKAVVRHHRRRWPPPAELAFLRLVLRKHPKSEEAWCVVVGFGGGCVAGEQMRVTGEHCGSSACRTKSLKTVCHCSSEFSPPVKRGKPEEPFQLISSFFRPQVSPVLGRQGTGFGQFDHGG